ncbi:hypothetical protein [Brevundimonas lenta]|uniref:Uncharacterized protein n=1 Tax=Brevundimonas lenta TaxID=424796 RepID=A0A7W6JBM2_9CAUL|nr:hypothetical protein [Brevundimonas lenta]MBB4082094.1 hypothetical protein [Brevundimonas lenta]
MAQRSIRTDRLIPILGVAVIVLGALILWLVTRGGFGTDEPSPEARARVQVREHLGRQARISYTEEGRRLAVCGYITDGDEVIAFISRPNRLMLETDPLKQEFRQIQRDLCPGFLTRPPAIP